MAMRAIVSIPHADGTYDNVGMNRRYISNEYKTERNLIHNVQKRNPGQKLRLEVWYSWDNRYSEPNKIIFTRG